MKKALFIALVFFSCFLAISNFTPLSKAGPPAKWKAVILKSSANLRGDSWRLDTGNYQGYVYDDAEDAIDAYAVIGTINSNPRAYRTIFHFFVYYPEKVFFHDIDQRTYIEESAANPPLVKCGFPDPTRKCLFDFLNGQHPYDNQYLAIQFGFYGPWTYVKNEADWEAMPILGDPKPMRMWVYVDAKNLYGDCVDCNTNTYHSIEVNTFDSWLQRTGTNDWTFTVDATFNNPNKPISPGPSFDNNYLENEFIAEKYCERVQTKSGKRILSSKVTRWPAWGGGNMAFQIKFVKY